MFRRRINMSHSADDAAAAERWHGLAHRGAQPKDRKPVTREDAERAVQHAEEAHQLAADAHHTAAELRQKSAALYDRAAAIHERARAAHIGDETVHRQAAQRHREAARWARAAAEIDQDFADSETVATRSRHMRWESSGSSPVS
jgi:hypothetical protein